MCGSYAPLPNDLCEINWFIGERESIIVNSWSAISYKKLPDQVWIENFKTVERKKKIQVKPKR